MLLNPPLSPWRPSVVCSGSDGIVSWRFSLNVAGPLAENIGARSLGTAPTAATVAG